jgi:hypothetical protein
MMRAVTAATGKIGIPGSLDEFYEILLRKRSINHAFKAFFRL